jgi:hypothetical protein
VESGGLGVGGSADGGSGQGSEKVAAAETHVEILCDDAAWPHFRMQNFERSLHPGDLSGNNCSDEISHEADYTCFNGGLGSGALNVRRRDHLHRRYEWRK